ncbi:DUF202 domain-containing protein [Leclercia adecarboxylata]|uniref:YidH family protein n=1 Tax=Leclercia adecarboxylata TaxID=83655 RepID=UPI002029C1F5|nr:DUF202 domain-containing protein [Leclercia adecarboxylata]URN97433.1 DUF202 domain-containing protein [Leclercia adecarboxylata]
MRERWQSLFKKSTTPWWEEGDQPDYRFSLANERTFLAWIRTALALLAGAIALEQLVSHYNVPEYWRYLALSLTIFGGLTGLISWLRWRTNEIAMRHSRALKLIKFMPFLALYLLIIAVFLSLFMF